MTWTTLLIGILAGLGLAAAGLLAAAVIWALRNRAAIMTAVAEMPTTNVRIALTLLLVLLTGTRYLLIGEPAGDGWESWLTFLAAMAGIDVLQFASKRATVKPDMFAAGLNRESIRPSPAAPGAATVPASDVSPEGG